AARGPDAAARPHALRAGGRGPRDRPADGRVRLDAAVADPEVLRRRAARGAAGVAGAHTAVEPVRRWIGGAAQALALLLVARVVAGERPAAPTGRWLREAGLEPRYCTGDGLRLRYV